MNILVTGGTGYIGSHAVVELLSQGYSVTVIDDLSNSSAKVLQRVTEITRKSATFYQLDLCDRQAVDDVFTHERFDAVIHFAGFKAVGESVKKPLEYYDNNINSTLSILYSMVKHDVNKLVFSSSATVYGNPGTPKYTEALPIGNGITSPYGQTKFMIEKIITDLCVARPEFHASLLRYFNPIGAHPSGLIGEDPIGVPNNLMPYIAQVAAGTRDKLSIFGDDYPTPDGTCLRDYIHVEDVARGHSAALEHLRPGAHAYNLGSGSPTSVLQLIQAFEESTGITIPYEFAARRAGDLPEFYADATKASEELNWTTYKTVADACRDTWNWQSRNPNGYRDA